MPACLGHRSSPSAKWRSKDPAFRRVDRDFVFLLNAYDIEPGAYVPKVNTMTDFNLWTWNSRAFPGIDPLVCGLGDKVRVRFGNLSMTNHPIHMHGYDFKVSCTDGGWVPEAAAWPEVTIDCAVGQMRAFDFVADRPGDWAIHCHKAHHTMNAMGHDVRTWIGTDRAEVTEKVQQLVPDYMSMGASGMAEAYIPDESRSVAWNRGKYLVWGPAHCAACHTPRNVVGGLPGNQVLSGDQAMQDGGTSPPITPQVLTSRDYTKDNLVQALRTGVTPDGDVFGGSMAEVVHGSTKLLLGQHLEDIATYLLDVGGP